MARRNEGKLLQPHFYMREGVASAVMLALPLLVSPAYALDEVSDDQLSEVMGADGISIKQISNRVGSATTTTLGWKLDQGVATISGVAVTGVQSELRLSGVTLTPIGTSGTTIGTPMTLAMAADFGGAEPNMSAMSLSGSWTRNRLQLNSLTQMYDATTQTKSMGVMALDSSGSFTMGNTRGLFDNSNNNAYFNLNIPDAQVYYRQGAAGSPEFMLDKLSFTPNFTGGQVTVDSQGLLVSAPTMNWNLLFDLKFEPAPVAGTGYFTSTSATDIPLLSYGWSGALTSFSTRIKPGGFWHGLSGTQYNMTNRSEGINFDTHWNYDPSFALVIGEAGGARTTLKFSNWTTLAGNTYAFNFPNMTLDLLNAGGGPGGGGVSGLCWGANFNGLAAACGNAGIANRTGVSGQFVDVAAENGGLGIAIRDAKLQAYNTVVQVLDDMNGDGDYLDTQNSAATGFVDIPETQLFNWGLMYTYGDMDANIYLYPGGKSGNTGLKGDVLITAQTHDLNADKKLNNSDWSGALNLMIADTTANTAFGWMNGGILAALDDVYLTLMTTSTDLPRGGVELETTNKARINLRGQLGGGDVTGGTLNTQLRISDTDINLEMSKLNLTIEPPASGQSYMGYSGFVRVGDLDVNNFSAVNSATVQCGGSVMTSCDSTDDGTYISLSEKDRPTLDARFSNITGDIAIQNGKFDLKSDLETPIGVSSELVLSQDTMIGLSAAYKSDGTARGVSPCPSGCQVFQIGRVEFSNQNLGSIVMPGGMVSSTLGLKKIQ